MSEIIIPQNTGAHLIDGKAGAQHVDGLVKRAVEALEPQLGRAPCLAVVLVGEDPASQVYVRNKIRRTEASGMISLEYKLPAITGQDELLSLIDQLNDDNNVDGILVQLPLPEHLEPTQIVERIHPEKDVDGLTSASAGALVQGSQGLRPCTPSGCVWLAKQALGDLSGKSVVIIGRSILVGKPAALLFLEANCTVTLAHSRTLNLPAVCAQADILVPAVGRANMVKADWVKPGAVVIDVGINRVEAGEGRTKLVGDASFKDVCQTAGFVTPVPGGVGPMTIAMLLANTVLAAGRRKNLKTALCTGLF